MVSYGMDPETDEVLRRVNDASAKIMELCDSLRIFVTRHDPETGHTQHMTFGAGNYYAQEGQVKEWVLKTEERTKCEVRNDMEE